MARKYGSTTYSGRQKTIDDVIREEREKALNNASNGFQSDIDYDIIEMDHTSFSVKMICCVIVLLNLSAYVYCIITSFK